MKVWSLLRKRNRRTKIIQMKPDADGNIRVLEIWRDDLKNTKRPPAWMAQLEAQLEMEQDDSPEKAAV